MKFTAKIFAALLLCLSFQAGASQSALSWSIHVDGTTLQNNIFAANSAISTLQSGSSDPGSNGGAYSLWADTGNTLLKQRNSANTGWVTVAPLGAQLLPLSGGSLSGSLSAPSFSAQGVSGSNRTIYWSTSGSNRWGMWADNTSESGSNAGSNFYFYSFNDGGSGLARIFSVTRSTGIVDFGNTPTLPTAGATDNTTKAATTAWVRTYAPSGTYTPTVSNTSNVFVGTNNADWSRVGNIVTVNGLAPVQPGSTGVCVFDVSLPIASNITGNNQVIGTGASSTSLIIDAAVVVGAIANPGRAHIIWTASGTGNNFMTYSFMYEVH